MDTTTTWQVHANVNTDHGDSRLHVTITFYDENGQSVSHRTWRAHTKSLWQNDAEWQAYSGVVDLCKMLAQVCNDHVSIDEPDEPMF